jgi:hypothetical protein
MYRPPEQIIATLYHLYIVHRRLIVHRVRQRLRCILRQPAKLRVAEFHHDAVTDEARRMWADERHERYLTARASAGTLAMAAGADERVCQTLCELDCAKTICALLESEQPELVHRALVWITEMTSAPENDEVRAQCATQLMEGGVVGAIGLVEVVILIAQDAFLAQAEPQLHLVLHP